MLRISRSSAHPSQHGELLALVPPFVRRLIASGVTDAHQRVEGTIVVASVRDHTAIPLLSEPLRIATARGGMMLKFSGDRLVLAFSGDDHERRAEATAGDLAIRFYATIGVASGDVDVFLLGTSHHELFVTGDATSRALENERHAAPGASSGRRVAPAEAGAIDLAWAADVSAASFVPEAIRRTLGQGMRAPRTYELCIAHMHLANLDELLADIGAESTTRHLSDLIARAERVFLEHDVAFIGSDIGVGGPTLLVAAGLPRPGVDDDERLLRALRDVATYPSPIELRTGVDRGAVRCGMVGTDETKTFIAMGAPAEMASELMTHARSGEVLATVGVIGRIDEPPPGEMTNISGEVVYRIAQSRRHHRGVSNMLINLGSLAYEHDDLRGARHYFEQALAVSRQLRYQADEAHILIHLGRVALALGDAERSMQLCDEALALLRDLDDDHATAEALALLGRARYRDGDSSSARLCWLRALEVLRSTAPAAERPSA